MNGNDYMTFGRKVVKHYQNEWYYPILKMLAIVKQFLNAI